MQFVEKNKAPPVVAMRLRRRPGVWHALAATALASFFWAGCFEALCDEYRLQPGDVVELSIAGFPELRQRMPIQIDGSISAPPFGVVHVVGLTSADMRVKVRAALVKNPLRYQNHDGQEIIVAIEPDAVGVSVSEYRPIYLSGDIAKPGEQPYRLGMTVRQAVAMAGGLEIGKFRSSNHFLDTADLKGEYKILWNKVAQLLTRAWRIKAELGVATAEFDQRQLQGAPLTRVEISQLIAAENETKAAHDADRRRERVFYDASIQQAAEQYRVIQQQADDEEKGTRADLQDLQKVVDLFGKGQATSPRVNDARRAFLLASTRKLQTTVQLMSLRRQQDDFTRQRERDEDQRKIALLREQEETDAALKDARDRLQAVGDKLRYLGALRIQPAGGSSDAPEVAIVRRRESGSERIEAGQESELQPGDVVEVALHDRFEGNTAER